jgi:hypothetical protein
MYLHRYQDILIIQTPNQIEITKKKVVGGLDLVI